MRVVVTAVVACLTLLLLASVRADERLAGIACRSVHLAYDAPESADFYNEITVQESATGTYFCVCGFNMGYFGIQELADGKKVVLFSVWDPGDQNDPNSVADDHRVRVLKQGQNVRVGRFGNEGTGAQSFYQLDWKPGETYRFLVKARPDGVRTAFAAYVYLPEDQQWKHLATFSTLASGSLIKGHYAFVEDFQRNKISATQARRALFGPGWVRTPVGPWVSLDSARFTADSNPATNIDASAQGQHFSLATGGDTKNQGTPLRQSMKNEAAGGNPPADLPATDD